jgi:hypothetical protein
VAADRPDDPADQPDERPDHPADRPNPPADDAKQSRRDQIEPRSRQEVYDAQHATTEPSERTEPPGRPEPGARSKPPEPTESSHQGSQWEETAELGRSMWAEYQRRWPESERTPVDGSDDPPGSWRGDGDRFLKTSDNGRIEGEYRRIVDRAEKEIVPVFRAIESQDPHRHLVGFEHHLKGLDRIKEKVHDSMKLKHHSASEAVSLLPDAIRFTFQYEEARYARGVRADIARLQEHGFKLDIPKNYWSDDQYKGFNSQWIEPVSGQRLEVQFHTRISYEAKQLTHPAYERLRTKQADALEELLLEAFQKKVTAAVPIPPGAIDISDHPERDQNAR